MTWADRLLRLALGDPKQEVVEHLRDMHQRSADQARRLAAGAAQAPAAAFERELHALAAPRGGLTAALAQALQERGAPALASAVPAPALNGAARNNWARLVAALEACREARARTLRATPRLLELDPSLAALLEESLRELDAELLVLRALIARADPQALD